MRKMSLLFFGLTPDYQAFIIGETHGVKGNLWESDSKLQITLKEIIE